MGDVGREKEYSQQQSKISSWANALRSYLKKIKTWSQLRWIIFMQYDKMIWLGERSSYAWLTKTLKKNEQIHINVSKGQILELHACHQSTYTLRECLSHKVPTAALSLSLSWATKFHIISEIWQCIIAILMLK